MTAYYNEIEPYAAQWLRNLIAAGHIAPGEVDERSIRDVAPEDVAGFDQAHFFAGIGVWSHALRLAGWPDDQPVWTGSCPCQPFSVAGKQLGAEDERHLWPEFARLIRERRPSVVLGEQVASALGRDWFVSVRDDLEALGYAVAAADLGAASVGAPHIRQRLWWAGVGLGNASSEGLPARERKALERAGRREEGRAAQQPGCASGGVDDATSARHSGPKCWTEGQARDEARVRLPSEGRPTGGFWADAEWIPCRDGKARPVEPGTFPLAHGAPARVGRLRAYGNAIVAPLAAEFIQAVMDCRP